MVSGNRIEGSSQPGEEKMVIPTAARLALALVLTLGITTATRSPILAAPITYTEEATASGSIGTTPFNNAHVVLRMTNDASNVRLPGGLAIIDGEATVSVSPIGGPSSLTGISGTFESVQV